MGIQTATEEISNSRALRQTGKRTGDSIRAVVVHDGERLCSHWYMRAAEHQVYPGEVHCAHDCQLVVLSSRRRAIDHNSQIAAEGKRARRGIRARKRWFHGRRGSTRIEEQRAAAGVDAAAGEGHIAVADEVHICAGRAGAGRADGNGTAVGVANIQGTRGDEVEFRVGEAEWPADRVGGGAEVDLYAVRVGAHGDAAAAVGADSCANVHAVGDEGDVAAIGGGGNDAAAGGIYANSPGPFLSGDAHLTTRRVDLRRCIVHKNPIVLTSGAVAAVACDRDGAATAGRYLAGTGNPYTYLRAACPSRSTGYLYVAARRGDLRTAVAYYDTTILVAGTVGAVAYDRDRSTPACFNQAHII